MSDDEIKVGDEFVEEDGTVVVVWKIEENEDGGRDIHVMPKSEVPDSAS